MNIIMYFMQYCCFSPLAQFCHLSVRKPLQCGLLSVCSQEHLIEVLLSPHRQSLAEVRDALLYLSQIYQQQHCLPPQLQALIHCQPTWHTFTPYQSKLTR